MAANENNLIWLDLEMTGLDPFTDHVLEIATLVTNSNLEVIAEGPVVAIHQPAEVLAGLDDWNRQHHGASGLLERVRASAVDEAGAESQTLAFLARHVPASASPLCGNSICQDRRFLARWMPRLEAYFHYRNLDVSTLKELCKRWKPELAKGVTKNGKHTALADIYESIEEMKYYREHFIRL